MGLGNISASVCALWSSIYISIQRTFILNRTQVQPVKQIYRKLNYSSLPNGPVVVGTV